MHEVLRKFGNFHACQFARCMSRHQKNGQDTAHARM
jgi:hypothetical protein